MQAQTYADWQLIIVDDGSTNAYVPGVLTQLESQDKRREVVRLPSCGTEEERLQRSRPSVAVNAGLDRVCSELITYLTDDDLYLPCRLDKMVQKFQAEPGTMIVYGVQRLQNGDGREWIYAGLRGPYGVTRNPQCRIDFNSFMHRASSLSVRCNPRAAVGARQPAR